MSRTHVCAGVPASILVSFVGSSITFTSSVASAREAELSAIVDSRGESQLALTSAIGGVNCELARGQAAVGHLADGTTAFGERLDVCPWAVGALDLHIGEDVIIGRLPRLADPYVVAAGTPYEHVGYSVELTLFDLADAFDERIADPAPPGEKPRVSMKKLLKPQANRFYPLPVWMHYGRTTQSGRTLATEDWGFSVMRYQREAGYIDVFMLDVSAATWGDGIGVSPITAAWFRMNDLPVGPFEIDAMAGISFDGKGTSQSDPQFTTMTPSSLGDITEFVGRLQVRERIGALDWTGGIDRTLAPFLADGLSVDTRVNVGATADLGIVDRLGVRGWAAFSELIGADGSDVHADTWGAGVVAGVRLGHRFRFDLDADLGRSFYARLGGAPASPSFGAMVTATLSARFGL